MRNNLVLFVVLFSFLAFMAGCSENNLARNYSLNKYSTYHVVQYSGGKVVGEWDTSSRPLSEEKSDGFTFVDSKTGSLVFVAGDLQFLEKK